MINLLLGDFNIELRQWEEEAEMLLYISRASETHIILGQEEIEATKFYSLVVSPILLESTLFGVGIRSESAGLTPQLMLQNQTQSVIVGFNSCVVGVDLNEKKVKFEVTLPFLFFTLSLVKDLEILLTICELGVVALSPEGEEIWRYETQDIVNDWKLEGDILRLDFLDEAAIKVDLIKGTKL